MFDTTIYSIEENAFEVGCTNEVNRNKKGPVVDIAYHCHIEITKKTLLLKAIKIGMITNGLGRFQLNNIESLGIANDFDEILVSEIEGVSKPDREIFYRAVNRLNVNVEEAIFVGDHPINDVLASKDVRMISVWKRNNQVYDDVAAHETIENLLDLQQIIMKYNLGNTTKEN